MGKVYLIGGAPRTGKTTLTIRILKEKPILAASTDALRYTLRQVIKESEEPDLFHLGKYTSNEPSRRERLLSKPLEIVDQQNKESEIVWRSTVDFINSNLEDGFDVLIEGIAIIPEFVSKLTCDYSAVFIGNQSSRHFKTILQAARSNPNDWLHSLEDETIEAFTVFNQHFSKFLQENARENGMKYVDIRDEYYEKDLDSARNLLLNI